METVNLQREESGLWSVQVIEWEHGEADILATYSGSREVCLQLAVKLTEAMDKGERPAKRLADLMAAAEIASGWAASELRG